MTIELRSKRVLVLCVVFNSEVAALNYFQSIIKSANYTCVKIDFYLIDNSDEKLACDKEKFYELKRDNISFYYIRSKNTGYFPSVGAFMESNTVIWKNYDYTIISNADLELDRKFFLELSNCVLDNTNLCIAPKIFSRSSFLDKNPKIRARPSFLKLLMLMLCFRYSVLAIIQKFVNINRLFIRETLSNFKGKRKFKTRNNEKIYAGHGSFLILTKEMIDRGFRITYPIFLFGEEIYLAEEIRKLKGNVIYKKDLIVYDDEHISTGSLSRSNYNNRNYEALRYLLEKYYW